MDPVNLGADQRVRGPAMAESVSRWCRQSPSASPLPDESPSESASGGGSPSCWVTDLAKKTWTRPGPLLTELVSRPTSVPIQVSSQTQSGSELALQARFRVPSRSSSPVPQFKSRPTVPVPSHSPSPVPQSQSRPTVPVPSHSPSPVPPFESRPAIRVPSRDSSPVPRFESRPAIRVPSRPAVPVPSHGSSPVPPFESRPTVRVPSHRSSPVPPFESRPTVPVPYLGRTFRPGPAPLCHARVPKRTATLCPREMALSRSYRHDGGSPRSCFYALVNNIESFQPPAGPRLSPLPVLWELAGPRRAQTSRVRGSLPLE